MIVGVIMAGGKGERFWPLSRINRPKQLINFVGKETLLQESINRIKPMVKGNNILIATTEELVQPIKKYISNFPKENIITEPVGRNTAPCLAMANVYAEQFDSDPTIVVLTSDHLIWDKNRFREAVKSAVKKAEEEECLVTFGMIVERPETGFGYIEREKKVNGNYPVSIYRVKKFIEKPSSKKAKEYMSSGRYFWNSGIFVWKSSSLKNAFKKFSPEIYDFMRRLSKYIGKKNEKTMLRKMFYELPSISIDYAVMEKADNVYVVEGDFGWDDIGAWTALKRIYQPDEDGNVFIGDVVDIDSKNVTIFSNNAIVATLGVKDLVIVSTKDAVLVCPKNRCQDIKMIVNLLREKGYKELL